MATITITHLGVGGDLADLPESDIYLRDLNVALHFGSPITITRPPGMLAMMEGIAELAGATVPKISFTETLTAAEKASGTAAPSDSIQASDIAAVASTAALSGAILVRKDCPSGGTAGTADDVVIIAAGALPRKLRVIEAWAFVTADNTANPIVLRDEAAGAGTIVATMTGTALGRTETTTLGGLLTPGATKGLFVRRDDRHTACVVYALLRPEE